MATNNPGETEKNVAAEASKPQSTRGHMIPVWFFVGLLLLIYGVLIFFTGLSEWSHPPAIVLPNLHVSFWWGILLILIGAVFTIANMPKKKH